MATNWTHYDVCEDPRDGCGAPAGRPCVYRTGAPEAIGQARQTPHDHRLFLCPDDQPADGE